jgi:Carboxypeptidase regulatory-like domain
MGNLNGNLVDMCRLRNHGALILITLLGALPGRGALAQTLPIQPATALWSLQNAAPAQVSIQQHAVASIAYGELPDAPGEQTTDPQTTDPQSSGWISGVVLDAKGAEVSGAFLTLEINGSKTPRTMATSGDGSFQFNTVESGTFKLTVASPGFATWVSPALVLQPGQRYEMQPIVLQIARASTNVDVVFTQYDLAEEQIHMQEKQRVLGVIPNFYVSYVWNAAPLTTGQKFKLAFRSEIDPISFVGAAFGAGIEQWQNDYRGYGEGAKGYFTRMGASYGDGFTNAFIAGAILPSVLHQDPRYFYKGTGSIRSRALYAMSAIVICKGDNRRWEPNYSNVFGNFASGALSNSYYPPANRGVRLTLVNATLATASGAINNLLQEFLIKKISRGVQP